MGETLRKGDLAEVAVMNDLMKKGYKICIPYGSDWRFDLLVFHDKNYKRVQVKTLIIDSQKPNRLIVRCNTHNPYKGTTRVYRADEVDYIAAYHPKKEYVVYAPIEDFNGQHGLSLRESIEGHTDHNKTTMKLVSDYMEIKI
jgi:hypothetical protein